MADEKITLGVDIDARKAEESIERLKKALIKLKIDEFNGAEELRTIAREIGKAKKQYLDFLKMLESAKSPKAVEAIENAIKEIKKTIKNLKAEYYKIAVPHLNVKDAIKAVNAEIKNIKEEPIRRLKEAHKSAEEAAKAHAKAEASLAKALARGQAELENRKAQKRNQVASIAAENFARKMRLETAAVVENERKMAAAMSPLSQAFYKLSGVSSRVLGGISYAFRRIIRLAASAFIFNVMSAGFRSMSKWITHLLYLDQEFVGSLRQIKANLLTAFAPIYQAVLPLLKKMGQAIVWVTQYLAKLISLLTGTSLEVNQQSARNMDFEVKRSIALEKASKRRSKNDKKRNKEANKEAKELNKSLAKFDKLDVWKQDKTSGSDKLDKIKGLKKEFEELDDLDGLDGLNNLDIPESKLEFKKLEDWNTSALEWAENTNAFINKLKEIPKNIDEKLDKLDKIKPGSKKFIKNLGVGALATTGLGLLTKGKIFKPVGKFLIGGAKVLTSTFKGVKNFAKPIGQGIKGGYQAFKINRLAGTPLWEGTKNILKPIGSGIKESFKPIKEWGKKYFNKGTWGAIKTFAKAHPAITGALGVGALATYGVNKYFGYKDWKGKLPEEYKKGKNGFELFKKYMGKTFGSDLLDLSSLFGFKSSDEVFEESFGKPFQRWLDKQSPEFKSNKSEKELALEYLKEVGVTNKKQDVNPNLDKSWNFDIFPKAGAIYIEKDGEKPKKIDEENKEEKKEYKNPYFSIPGFGKIDLNTGKAPISFDWEKTQKDIEENLGKIGEKFKQFFNDTGEASKSLWEKAKGKFDDWKKWLGEKFDDTKNWVGEKFEWIGKESEKMWEAMKKAPKAALNWLLEQTEFLLNKIIWGINWFIRQANKISFDLPDWLGGSHFGINIPEISEVKIPRLAKGSVLKGGNPFLAWVNDQPRGQTNIETPLDTIVQAFKEVVGNKNGNQNIVIEANGDLGSIIREFNFKLKNENIRVGKDLMIAGGAI